MKNKFKNSISETNICESNGKTYIHLETQQRETTISLTRECPAETNQSGCIQRALTKVTCLFGDFDRNQLSTYITIVLALTSVLCLTVVCIIAIRNPQALLLKSSTGSLGEASNDKIFLRILGRSGKGISKHESLQNENIDATQHADIPEKNLDNQLYLASSARKIKFQVDRISKQPDTSIVQTHSNLKMHDNHNDETFVIQINSERCKTPADLHDKVFNESRYLILNRMSDCVDYTNLVLTEGKFPNVEYIRLEEMTIQQPLFKSLIKFIDRHNQTIKGVDIYDCYLCPSPECDAGMINYPDHDFEFKMSKRRGQP